MKKREHLVARNWQVVGAHFTQCSKTGVWNLYHILSSIVCTFFYMENDAEIFPAHYTIKVTEKGLKMASIINKLAMINSCEIILEK